MTAVLMRTLLVLAAWGVAFGAALAGGAEPRAAELAAMVGAGVTLLAWGLLGGRARESAAGEPPSAHTGLPRERDAV